MEKSVIVLAANVSCSELAAVIREGYRVIAIDDNDGLLYLAPVAKVRQEEQQES